MSKQKKCPCCKEVSVIRKIEGFRVFFEGYDICTYWTRYGRADVVERVKEDERFRWLEEVAKTPYTHHYECSVNYCRIEKDLIENPSKYQIFKGAI